MNPTLRRILFFIFVIGFVLGAPLLVLYTAGFRYNWQSGTLIRTGVLSISTMPRSVNILLEGKEIDRQTPAVIKQLMPGTYDLTLSKDDYHSWHNIVTIQSSITTHLPLVYLWRSQSPINIWQRQVNALTPSPDGSLAAYLLQQGGWNELWLSDLTNGEEKMIARIAGDNENLSIAWSTPESNLLLQDQNLNTLAIYSRTGVNLETSVSTITDYLNELNLTLDNGDTISLFDTATQTELRRTAGNETKTIALLPKGQYTTVQRDENLLLLKSAQGELLVINLTASEPILFKQRVVLYDYLEAEHLLLWSDGYEINIYNPTNHQIEFITRQSEPITRLQWFPDGSAILLGSANNLLAIDRYKNGEQRYVVTLATTEELQNFWTSADSDSAYLDATINGQTGLFSLRLR